MSRHFDNPADAALRALGLVLALVFLLAYAPSAGIVTQVLTLSALLVGSWLILRSPTAIALAIMFVAAAHTEPGAEGVWAGQVCPLLAVVSGAFVVGSLARRFRHRILHTRDARWAQRNHG